MLSSLEDSPMILVLRGKIRRELPRERNGAEAPNERG